MALETPQQLILGAFRAARLSGKSDWTQMTLPVLKNRILQLTNGEFTEHQHGASNLREFVAMADDIIRVTEYSYPTKVELLPHAAAQLEDTGASLESAAAGRIRPDLWHAILDYSRGQQFIWDVSQRVARVANDTEETQLSMPTIDETELSRWRAEFVDRHKEVGSDFRRLEIWRDEKLPAKALPPELIASWYTELKERVKALLLSWFHQNHIPVPKDLIQPRERALPKATTDARQLVMDSVGHMTEEELLQLRLPVSVILRLQLGRIKK